MVRYQGRLLSSVMNNTRFCKFFELVDIGCQDGGFGCQTSSILRDCHPEKKNLREASLKEQELAIKVEELTTVKARNNLVEDLRRVGEEYSEEKTHAFCGQIESKDGVTIFALP